MGRSKAVMLGRMRKYIDEMKPFIKMVKRNEEMFDFDDDSVIVPASLMREGYDWIMGIMEGTFLKVKRAWSLCPEEVWKRYFIFGGFEDHREMIILKAALKEFRKQITTRTRPRFFLKGKRNAAVKKILTASKSKSK